MTAGGVPTTGPGVKVVVDDAPNATTDQQQVLDKDLQKLVNALWLVGAEGVSINDQRITNLTAIRQAGSAITANFVSLRRPYVVRAIGNKNQMAAKLLDTEGGRTWSIAALHLRPEVRHRLRGLHDLAPGRPVRPALRPAAGASQVIAAIGLLLGLLLGLVLTPEVPIWLEPYLPIAVVAALDAVFGALRAFLDGIFDDKVFVVSFVSNVLIAGLIVYLGDKLGVGGQLSTGVIVVLGIRIFSNVAAIRRHIFHA